MDFPVEHDVLRATPPPKAYVAQLVADVQVEVMGYPASSLCQVVQSAVVVQEEVVTGAP